MDYETIENEVYNFVAVYFKDVSPVVESSLNFIEVNNLFTPKNDFRMLIAFLNKTINNFKSIDDSFFNSTLKKLQADVIKLELLHKKTVENTSDISDIFKNEFVNFSPVLNIYSNAIKKIDNQSKKTPEDISRINHLKQNFLHLKKIYYDVFEEIFFEEKRTLIKMLKEIINTKCYYLDKLIWKHTDNSTRIRKHLEVRGMEKNYDAQGYINYISSLMRTYTDDYKYLQKCLRIYR